MKVIYRLSPGPQYEYVEVHCDVTSVDEGKILETYRRLSEAFVPTAGIPEKEMNEFIDRMLLGQQGNHIEQYEAMNDKQKDIIQCLKRALKRIKSKNE